jgi:hypothetical protein
MAGQFNERRSRSRFTAAIVAGCPAATKICSTLVVVARSAEISVVLAFKLTGSSAISTVTVSSTVVTVFGAPTVTSVADRSAKDVPAAWVATTTLAANDGSEMLSWTLRLTATSINVMVSETELCSRRPPGLSSGFITAITDPTGMPNALANPSLICCTAISLESSSSHATPSDGTEKDDVTV